MHSNVLLTFSSVRFNVVDFILRSLLYLNLSFVHRDKYGSSFILPHVDYPVMPAPLVEYAFSIFLSARQTCNLRGGWFTNV